MNKNKFKKLKTQKNKIKFIFDGKTMFGFKGDTLASALLANNINMVGRSFKYHRPRGIFTSGVEEPNALVEVIEGKNITPNIKATTLELYEGLIAKSQNYWPSLKFDILCIFDLFSNFLVAGFYYKTFKWPSFFWEKLYEPMIRKAAGLGKVSADPSKVISEKGYLFCDFLVIGSGPTGLLASLILANSGKSVILMEQDFVFGGSLNRDNPIIDNFSSKTWKDKIITELENLPNVRTMKRTTVLGMYDHSSFSAIQTFKKESVKKQYQILWRVKSKKTFLCSGSTERHISFQNNDIPGIMLSSSIREYTNRWQLKTFKNVVFFTNNDYPYYVAKDLISRGAKQVSVVDVRKEIKFSDPKISIYKNAEVINTKGKKKIEGVFVKEKNKPIFFLNCDTLGVSGGWNANIQISTHTNEKPVWNEKVLSFVQKKISKNSNIKCLGSADGIYELNDLFVNTKKEVFKYLKTLNLKSKNIDLPNVNTKETYNIKPFWFVKYGGDRKWVDFQNDVTVKDIQISYQENFRSIEHLKRYSTLGMGTDQGKVGNIVGLGILSEISNKSIRDIGTSTFRPPYVPASIDAFVGFTKNKSFKAKRLTPSHAWSKKNNGEFVETGLWYRSQWYSKKNEKNWLDTVNREVLNVRNNVGFCDVSTLGKIDIQGKDSLEFINKIYCNNFNNLSIGKVKYGLMLREDGMIMDDGTTARLDESHFIMTTTTSNAEKVYQHLEFCHQCLWPYMDVNLISITDSFSQFSVAGPNSRKLLQSVLDNSEEISNENLPFMGFKKIRLKNGLSAKIFRISFSGELAYEISIETQYSDVFLEILEKKGKRFNLSPYGTEALSVLRIEKGHISGPEINGNTSPLNVNMLNILNFQKDCVGNVLFQRKKILNNNLRLVGLLSDNKIHSGSLIFDKDMNIISENELGYVSSSCFSPCLGKYIALCFFSGGEKYFGKNIIVKSFLKKYKTFAKICSPVFIDKEGKKLRV